MWTELQPGTLFGHDYRILRHIASGGMGSIYLVEQLSTGKPRALKVMHPQYARDERLRARFEKEARVASLIESDHVIEVLAAGVDKATGIPWLVMEYLRGDTLDDVVAQKGPLPIPDMLEVARQLLHGLECAHRQSLVHRDLKPENIFIAQPRRTDVPFTVKILDFGIAKWAQDARQKSKNSEVLGSPFWMAPEQLQAGADISPATDVWAVGLIVFWALTGHFYWRTGNLDDATIEQVIREMTVEPMPPASARLALLDPTQKLPRRFDAWFERTTQRMSERRFQSGGEALSLLLPILTEHMNESPKPVTTIPIPLGPKRDISLSLSMRSPIDDKQLWQDLTAMLRQEIARGGLAPAEVQARWMEVAQVREHELADVVGAGEAWRFALRVGPISAPLLGGAAEFLTRKAKSELGPKLVRSLLETLAERGDADAIVALLARAFELSDDPGPLRAWAALGLVELSNRHPIAGEARRRVPWEGLRESSEARAESAKEAAAPPKAAENAPKAPAPTPSSPTSVPLAAPAPPSIVTPAEPPPTGSLDAGRISDVGRISDLPSIDDPIAALTANPSQVDAWSSLFKRRLQERNLDGAWCVADAATAMLGDRTPDVMKQLRSRHAAGAGRRTLAPLSEDQWKALCDPSLEPATTEVLKGLIGVLQALKSAPVSQRSPVLPHGGTGPKSSPPAGAAKVLYGALLEAGVALSISPLPSIEVRPDKPFGLWFSGAMPPSSIVGSGSVRVTQPRPWRAEQITFAAGQHMAYYRPELMARLLTSGEGEIQQALEAARSITLGKGQSPLATPLAQRLGSGDRMRLRRVVSEAIAASGGMDAARWQRAADRTAARAGFLASRDFSAARDALRVIDPLPGAPGADEQMHNLVLFGVSDPYLKLRRELEIALL
jgi:serine/threonine protein kinase